MPDFNIVKETKIKNTFRVSKIKNDFDVEEKHLKENFVGNINFPDEWQIGLIVGGSGTGKSTIASELFSAKTTNKFEYVSDSVIDDMPDKSVDEITKMFYAVGFGSVPNWLKPYRVLSNGEKMRVDLARSMLESDFVVFDEFTSVVDREVAKTISRAIKKMIKKYPDKKFVAISCHFDIVNYLQPDWIFNTNDMKQVFMLAHDPRKNTKFEDVNGQSGQSLDVITI